jgi:hypothetical protein
MAPLKLAVLALAAFHSLLTVADQGEVRIRTHTDFIYFASDLYRLSLRA